MPDDWRRQLDRVMDDARRQMISSMPEQIRASVESVISELRCPEHGQPKLTVEVDRPEGQWGGSFRGAARITGTCCPAFRKQVDDAMEELRS